MEALLCALSLSLSLSHQCLNITELNPFSVALDHQRPTVVDIVQFGVVHRRPVQSQVGEFPVDVTLQLIAQVAVVSISAVAARSSLFDLLDSSLNRTKLT